MRLCIIAVLLFAYTGHIYTHPISSTLPDYESQKIFWICTAGNIGFTETLARNSIDIETPKDINTNYFRVAKVAWYILLRAACEAGFSYCANDTRGAVSRILTLTNIPMLGEILLSIRSPENTLVYVGNIFIDTAMAHIIAYSNNEYPIWYTYA